MFKKLSIKKNGGSAMILVIIAMALFLIISTTIMSQINNQIRSNLKIYNETKNKYKAESIVDERIAGLYSDINKFITEIKGKYSGKQPLNENEKRKQIFPNDAIKAIDGKQIKANIFQVYREEKDLDGNINKVNIRQEIDNFDISNFKNIHIEGRHDDKYKVTSIVGFNIDGKFNLLYEVKAYDKGPIN